MDKTELLKIIDEEEDNYTWGGSEDSEGCLSKGCVDFDRIKKAIKKL